MPIRVAVEPAARDSDEFGIAADPLHPLMVTRLQGSEPVKYVGCLTNEQPQVGELEWDILEPEECVAACAMTGKDLARDLEAGQRNTSLDAAKQFQQLEVNVRGVREVWLTSSQGAQLHHLPALGAAAAHGLDGKGGELVRRVGHAAIIPWAAVG